MSAKGLTGEVLVNKWCRKCGKVHKNRLNCIQCGVIMHPTCVRKSNVTKIDDNQIICCKEITDANETLKSISEYDLDQSFSSAMETNENDPVKVELVYLKELLKHKDYIIKKSDEVIKSLNQQIHLLNNSLLQLHSTPSSSYIHNSEDKTLPAPSGSQR